MNMKAFIGVIGAALAASCATATTPPNYTVNVMLTPDEDGMVVYMMDYDTSSKIDSALVENGVAHFSGNVTAPSYVRMVFEGSRIGDFILEPATVTLAPAERKLDSDGKMQGDLNKLIMSQRALVKQYNSLPQDSTSIDARKDIVERYEALADSALDANAGNVLGYVLFVSKDGLRNSLADLDAALDKYPQFKTSKRMQSLRDHLLVKEETSVGHKYKDFAITNDGKTQRLSDYVGNGHYTLVDFWASWCGPCIRETKVIKDIYNKYNGKGLEVLGVAVWDEPANTLKAIEEHQLPWNQIINAQTIPTDLYGISGIPCIILIDPQGNIVSRDKQDQDLIDDVDAAMATMQSAKQDVE